MSRALLAVGESGPWFEAPCASNPKFHFSSVAGRYIILAFFQSAGTPAGQRIVGDFVAHRHRYDTTSVAFFGVTTDPEDVRQGRLQEDHPGVMFFWDFGQAVSRLYGLVDESGAYRPCTYILDERLRVYAVVPIDDQVDTHVTRVLDILAQAPPIPGEMQAQVQAPVLIVPRIFEPELCRALMAHYDQHGGEESGFMREIGGRTVGITDPGFKRRRDQEIVDEKLKNAAMFRLHGRLVPELHRAFQFHATRIERHIIACYDSTSGGYFRPHRDNTTKGTAHRRFAVSLILNTGEFEGGQLRFPEFGRQTYSAPAGGAVVFSCSLLHEATPVTAGRRFVYLPFLYDEAAAKIREQNRAFLGEAPKSPST